MDYILEEMKAANADGVDFVPLDEVLMKKEHKFHKIIASYTKEQWIKEVDSYPKTPRLYWKMVDGKKTYC